MTLVARQGAPGAPEPARGAATEPAGTMPVSVTAQLCRKIVRMQQADLGADVLRAGRRLLLDGLAVAVAGAQEEAVRLLADHHRAQGSRPAATVLGLGFRAGSVTAAALNGAAMHVLDFEPMWSPANHAISTTLPAVLALAEVVDAPGVTGPRVDVPGAGVADATGAEVLTALVKGVEVQGWLRQASHQWASSDLIFHPPGVVGPIGAAVAAAHLLRLDEMQLRQAIGMAASRSSGLLANVGTMTKATHCGQAAASGLEAALLAARGVTANPDIFDVPQGFGDAFSADFAVSELLGFGQPFRIIEPGFAIKMFPCQFGTHFGITAGLAVRQQVADPERITTIRLTTPVMPYVDRPQPPTGLAGKFSLQYTLAAALLDGTVGLSTFRDERLRMPDMQRLLSKIELTMTPDIPGRFEDMHVVVEVDVDGRKIRERCDGPRGMWGSPPISDADHHRKVRDCLARALEPPDVQHFMDLAGRAEQLSNPELRQLIALAGRAPSRPA